MAKKPAIKVEIPNEDGGFAEAFASGVWENASELCKQTVADKLLMGVLFDDKTLDAKEIADALLKDIVKKQLEQKVKKEVAPKVKQEATAAFEDTERIKRIVHEAMVEVVPNAVKEVAEDQKERVRKLAEGLYDVTTLTEVMNPIVKKLTEPLVKDELLARISEVFSRYEEKVDAEVYARIEKLIEMFGTYSQSEVEG